MTVREPCDEGVIRAGAAKAPCSPAEGPWVLAATVLGSAMVFIEGSAVGVALPALQNALGATVVDIQWVVNAYALFLAALILLGGSLGDRFGRKRIFMLGVVVFTLASVGCGLALSTAQLIAGRALQGVGGALLTPGSLAIISASFPEAKRGAAIGLWSGFSAITAALGPLLGGWLIDTLSWRWIFFINLPLAILVLVISARFVPESRGEASPGGLDWFGAALVTFALGGLTYGLLESSNRGFGDPLIVVSLALGVLLLLLFVAVEARQRAPLMPLVLFRSATFSGANLLTLCLYAALGGALFFLPLNLIQVQGYSATAAGAALLPFILLLSLLSRWSGGLVARFGARPPLVAGSLLVAVSFGLFMLPGIGGSYWSTFFPAALVLGLGMAFAVAPLTTAVMNAVPTPQAGTASGINNAVSRVAGLFAVALFGTLMLGVFSDALRKNLQELGLPPELQTSLYADRANLAALSIPSAVDPSLLESIQASIDRAFVRGFRVLMALAALLALLSALVAWRMIDRDRAEVQVLELSQKRAEL